VLRNKSYRARAPVKTQVNGAKAQGATNDSTATPVARDKRAKCAWYARPPELRPPFGAPRCPAAMRGPAVRRASGATGAAMSAPNGLLGQYHDAAASRKRKASEHETEEHYGTAAAGAKRVNNGARSSLRGSAPPFQPQTGSPAFAPNAHNALFSGLPNLPPFPPGPLPPADFISMMAAFGKAMPGMPPLPVLKKNKEKCSHYYTKGHCALGTLCQFVHGDDAKFVPGDDPGFLHGDDATPANRIPEYDPHQSALSMQQQTSMDDMALMERMLTVFPDAPSWLSEFLRRVTMQAMCEHTSHNSVLSPRSNPKLTVQSSHSRITHQPKKHLTAPRPSSITAL
jgi:hypothetical protein